MIIHPHESIKLQATIIREQPYESFARSLPTSGIDNPDLLGVLIGVASIYRVTDFKSFLHKLLSLNANINTPAVSIGLGPELKGLPLTPLMAACRYGPHQNVVDLLAVPEIKTETIAHGHNLLYLAIFNPKDSVLIFKTINSFDPNLVSSPFTQVPSVNKNNALLELAMYQLNLEIVKEIIWRGCNHSELCESGYTMVQSAIWLCIKNQLGAVSLQILKQTLEAGFTDKQTNSKGLDSLTWLQTIPYGTQQQKKMLEEIILTKPDTCESPEKLTNIETTSQRHSVLEIETIIDYAPPSRQTFLSNFGVDNSPCSQRSHFIKRLSCEMTQYSQKCQQNLMRVWQKLDKPFLNLFSQILAENNCHYDFIGSFRTGLWSPQSDIDILIIPNSANERDEPQWIISILYDRLKRNKDFKARRIELNHISRFENLKIELDNREQFPRIEIYVNTKFNTSKKYVNYVHNQMYAFPSLKPTFHFLLKLFTVYQLQQAQRGGIKTYALFLMIQKLFKVCNIHNLISPGQLLFEFCAYYSHKHEYSRILNSRGQVTLSFELIDPLNLKNNMGGKNTRVVDLKKTLRCLYAGLEMYVQTSVLDYLIDLKAIFS